MSMQPPNLPPANWRPPPGAYGAPPPEGYGAPVVSPHGYGSHDIVMPGDPVSIGSRFVAKFIDGIITVLIFLACFGVAVLTEDRLDPISYLFGAVGLIIAALGYEYPFVAKFGQTAGKRIMNMRIVTMADGAVPGWGKAATRTLVPAIANVCTGIGGLLFYISPLFDRSPWKRGWHDQIAGTVVIARRPSA